MVNKDVYIPYTRAVGSVGCYLFVTKRTQTTQTSTKTDVTITLK